MIFYTAAAGFLIGFWHFLTVLIVKLFLTIFWMIYCLHFFSVHRNMMTSTPSSKNQH